jgi:hypothetical protein
MESHYTYWLTCEQTQQHYIGVRTCKGDPEKDPYMSSSRVVKAMRSQGLTFTKFILTVWSTRQEANEHEHKLLNYFHVINNPIFLNMCNSQITAEIATLGGKASKPTKEVHILGGRAQGKRNVESGQLASVRPVLDQAFQKKASARASRPVYALEDPTIKTSWNRKKDTEKRLGKSFTWVDV